MIKIVAKQTVQEGKAEEFLATAKELIEKSRAEAGNVFYTLNQSRIDPNQLVFIECWKDEDAIAAHNAAEHFNRFLPMLGALCEGEPSIEVFDEVI